MSIVRTSHYRHVAASVKDKREQQWGCVRPSSAVTETNKISVNRTGKLAAVCWQVGGGGAVGILKLDSPYRVAPDEALITGHSGPVSDVKFDPFHETVLASASDDGAVRIWEVPAEGLTESLDKPVLQLSGHAKKVVAIAWNPVAASILVSVGQDQEAIVWNVADGTEVTKISIGQYPTDVSFSPCGTLFAVSCKDKKIHIFDARSGEKRHEFLPHAGPRTPRLVWMKEHKVITVGNAGGMPHREFKMWDLDASCEEPLVTVNVSDGTQTLYPIYDPDCSMLYLVGKGDSSMRYYEIVYEQKKGSSEMEWKAYDVNTVMVPPAVGLAAVPKYLMRVNEMEIMRFFVLAKETMCQVEFNVPRRVKAYDPAIYPDTWAGVEACSASEWVGGSTAEPVKKSMKPEGGAAVVEEKKFAPKVTGAVDTRPKTPAEQLEELKEKYAALLAAYKRDTGKDYQE